MVDDVLVHVVLEGEKHLLWEPFSEGVEYNAHNPCPCMALGEDDWGAALTKHTITSVFLPRRGDGRRRRRGTGR